MKKITSLLLVFTLMACLLAGCGGKPGETETPPPPETTPVQSEPAAPADDTPAPTDDAPAPAAVDLTILYEADDDMINNYSLLAVNPDAPFVDADGNPVSDVYINAEGATALIAWMLSDAGKEAATNYGVADYGEHLFYWKDDAPVYTRPYAGASDDNRVIRLSTTTSVNDSGLLNYLLPQFEALTGYTVEVTSAGTGKAIANAKNGNADLLLVHSKSQEEDFIAAGFARLLDDQSSERLTFMYNYFVLCGPSDDPAGVSGAASVKDAFAMIAEGKYPFISRGDKSGTHTKELSLWPEDLGITDEAESVEGYTDWYTYSNAGMGVCLTMAEETHGYILSDKATFLTFRANNGIME